MPVLSIFGELETFIADELYPYRYVITPVLSAVGLGLLFLAYRRGAHLLLWRHRLASAVVGVPVLVVAVVVGNYLFSPLWERSFLSEDSPLVAAADAGPAGGNYYADPYSEGGTDAPFEPRTKLKGMFKGADDFHFGRGDALIIEASKGMYVVRFENFSVRNGPDLYVYLSRDAGGERVEEALNLGRLKATDGAFNYEIPAGIDLKGVKSVVVWCRQFDVLFAVAALNQS